MISGFLGPLETLICGFEGANHFKNLRKSWVYFLVGFHNVVFVLNFGHLVIVEFLILGLWGFDFFFEILICKL